MRLNKFISKSGYCSRRRADELIKDGKVKVNNKILKNPAYIALDNDIISINNNILKIENKLIYILLITPIRYHRIIIFFVPKMLVSLSLICLAIMEKILKLS